MAKATNSRVRLNSFVEKALRAFLGGREVRGGSAHA